MAILTFLSRSKKKCVSHSQECKRRILSAFRARFSKPNSQSKDCPILNLDADALNCIMDFLPPSSQMALLHTSKAVYNSLRGRVAHTCETATRQDYRQYLLLLCRSSLDRYACWDCEDIHNFYVKPKSIDEAITCPKQRSGSVRGSSLRGKHQLNLGQIQTASKLTRMGRWRIPRAYRRFLARTLKRTEDQHFVTRTSTSRHKHPVKLRSRTRIVDNRLYIKRLWEARYWDVNVRRRPQHPFGSVQVCPHMNTSSSRADPSCPSERFQQRHLSQAVQSALRRINQHQRLACGACPTDISVHTHRYKRRIVLVAWQCLGGEEVEGSYSYWERHCWRRGIPYSIGHQGRDWQRGTTTRAFEYGIVERLRRPIGL